MAPYKAGAASALHQGRTWKRIMRIEKACRLVASGQFNDGDIARHIGITPAFFSLLKQTPEFKARMIELRTGVVSQHDQDIKEDIEYQKQQMRAMVPQALSRLQNMILSANENIAFKASVELLDRQGDHAKVSRTNIDIHSSVDTSAADKVADDIFAILNAVTPTAPVPGAGAAPTGAADRQNMSAIIDEFTRGATDSNSQARIMAETVNESTLDSIDAARLGRPQ